ncbi:uncharacterized protein LOC133338458 [Musca vetustissima]|uniref:uncharacterized protein LOC133338458 n=1 Tax=Musca vetustissima TaxID=27455 RepID=UPI002AB6A547|nr:uncharacterized protein LOC133338458 [Musca vetustissima]
MNCTNENIKKLLTVVDSNDYLADLYKICLRKVQNGSLVVILTCQKFDISRLSPMKKMKISKEQMKRLIVINYISIDEITQKLLDTVTSRGCATFWDYLHSIEMQKEEKFKTRSTLPVYGIFIVHKEMEYFNEFHVEMLKSLYFYKDSMVDNILDIEDFLSDSIT